MNARTPITTDHAPKAIGPYSQAIRSGDFVFLSGQIPLDPATGEMVGGGDVRKEIEQVMGNIGAVLGAAGSHFRDIVKTTIFLVDLRDFSVVNEIYGRYFEGAAPPARSTIQVAALPRGAKVEVEVTARVP